MIGTVGQPHTCALHMLWRDRSYSSEQGPNTLQVPNNLICPKLAFAKDAVNKRDGYLTHSISKSTRSHHHLHLEDVTSRGGESDDVSEDITSVESEASCKVANVRTQCGVRQKVGDSREEFALEVPTVDTAGGGI